MKKKASVEAVRSRKLREVYDDDIAGKEKYLPVTETGFGKQVSTRNKTVPTSIKNVMTANTTKEKAPVITIEDSAAVTPARQVAASCIARSSTAKVKDAKRKAVGCCYLNKTSDSLTTPEREEKRRHFPSIQVYDETILGGECKCEMLVETAAFTEDVTPSRVTSEMIHSVVLNSMDK